MKRIGSVEAIPSEVPAAGPPERAASVLRPRARGSGAAAWTCLLIAAALLEAGTAEATVLDAQRLTPAADAYVDESGPKRNFGNARVLKVGRSPARRAYLRFATGSSTRIAKATLRLFAARDSRATVRVRRLRDGPWREGRITYRSAPEGRGGSVEQRLRRGGWTAVDVTDLVRAGGRLDFVLSARRGAGRLRSREAARAPELILVQPSLVPVMPDALAGLPSAGPSPDGAVPSNSPDATGTVAPTPAPTATPTPTATADPEPPSVSIVRPQPESVYTSAQTVPIEAAVSSDAVKVEFYDNGLYRGTEDTAPFVYSWAVSSAGNGAHTWTAKAYDAAGNAATSAGVSVTVAIPDAGGGGGGAEPTAAVETQPVRHAGDAADDSAIWIHPADPSLSTVIGTDKLGGLAVYDLSGKELHYYADGRPNNVDLRYNFPLAGERITLVVASDLATDSLRIYKVDERTRGLEYIASRTISTGHGLYGLCMYRSPHSGRYYALENDNSGLVQQWELWDTGGGKVDARKVRSFDVGSTTEGCVADDQLGRFYVSEEDVGIWRYGAEPTDGTARTKVDGLAGAGGHLSSDVEGLTLYYGDDGSGYLLASSQGSNDYAVYQRAAGNRYLTRFAIAAGAVDGVTYTDGIDVTNAFMGPAFPKGVFVAQDDSNTGPNANQNFKLVPWERIATAKGLDANSEWHPRAVGSPGQAYFVDSGAGDDSAAGTSPEHPWRSLARVESATLAPGDRVLLRRGGVWSGSLKVPESGTGHNPITISAYGSGAAPALHGGTNCVDLGGAHLSVERVSVGPCGYAGIAVSGSDVTVRDLVTSGNVTGVYVRSSAVGARILRSDIRDNDKMSDAACGGPGDSGAFGVLVHGDGTEIAGNTISGSDAYSCEYGRDGAAVEIYRGRNSRVHHNLGLDNDAFAELGEAGSEGNTFAYNVVRSNLAESRFVVTRGALDTARGPVLGTRLFHNTVRLTGERSQGFVCSSGCSPDVLVMRNNIIQAVEKVGYADAPFDEDHDLFFGGRLQFSRGAHSVVADPAFAAPAEGDLHISPSSPAVDAGESMSGYATDFDGLPVPVDGDGDSVSRRDMGAYELRR